MRNGKYKWKYLKGNKMLRISYIFLKGEKKISQPLKNPLGGKFRETLSSRRKQMLLHFSTSLKCLCLVLLRTCTNLEVDWWEMHSNAFYIRSDQAELLPTKQISASNMYWEKFVRYNLNHMIRIYPDLMIYK